MACTRIFWALAADAGTLQRLMIDVPHLKAHRTAASLLQKGAFPRCLDNAKGSLRSKLHAVCDSDGRPVALVLAEGHMSDHRGAALLLPALPPPREALADRGYDSNHFRDALVERGITPCLPSTKSRDVALPYDKTLYQQRHTIENMFGKLKDWRRIAARYDRCAQAFFSAIGIAVAVAFWL